MKELKEILGNYEKLKEFRDNLNWMNKVLKRRLCSPKMGGTLDSRCFFYYACAAEVDDDNKYSWRFNLGITGKEAIALIREFAFGDPEFFLKSVKEYGYGYKEYAGLLDLATREISISISHELSSFEVSNVLLQYKEGRELFGKLCHRAVRLTLESGGYVDSEAGYWESHYGGLKNMNSWENLPYPETLHLSHEKIIGIFDFSEEAEMLRLKNYAQWISARRPEEMPNYYGRSHTTEEAERQFKEINEICEQMLEECIACGDAKKFEEDYKEDLEHIPDMSDLDAF